METLLLASSLLAKAAPFSSFSPVSYNKPYAFNAFLILAYLEVL
jgi:hypothetical protein